METPPQEKSKGNLCTIRIAFPVESDEEAISLKKKIEDALADKPEARMDFGLMTMPKQ